MNAQDPRVQAAMPAMREWLCQEEPADTIRGRWNRGIAAGLADERITRGIEKQYPGGVDQFIKEQEERDD